MLIEVLYARAHTHTHAQSVRHTHTVTHTRARARRTVDRHAGHELGADRAA
eukprot:COSAG03_NODE_8343_length_811_cov_1.233146_1_plen_50_part_10